jgi:polyhydroxybutyrate depolymerase
MTTVGALDWQLSMQFGGRMRTFGVHVPARAWTAPFPVVVNFHGGGSNGAQQRGYSGMDAVADRHGFVVVYPDGTGLVPGQTRLLAFNAGRCCPPATMNNVDDVGFTHAIIALLGQRLPVDGGRIYATGMSNGGMMAHRMAAESPLVAAVASVAGQLNVATFAPKRAVPVMEFHSVDDRRARYGSVDPPLRGSVDPPLRRRRARGIFPPVEAGISQWAAHNGCPPRPTVSRAVTGEKGTLNEGQTVTVLSYGPGRDGSEVVLYKLTGAGHVWPGATTSLPRLLGPPTTLVDANEVMWRFFAAHPLP